MKNNLSVNLCLIVLFLIFYFPSPAMIPRVQAASLHSAEQPSEVIKDHSAPVHEHQNMGGEDSHHEHQNVTADGGHHEEQSMGEEDSHHGHHNMSEEGGHEDNAYLKVTSKTALHSSWPGWIILLPLLGALMLPALRRSDFGQGITVILTSGLTLAVSLLMYPLVIYGQKAGGTLLRGIYYSIPFLPSFQLNLTFKVDPAALTLVVFTCLVWFLVAIFSGGYLSVENYRLRYNIANLCCLSATLGAFLAGDLFTLYVFFESILLFLYLMVIHREDAQALKAARVYLYFGMFTGLMLLFGIFLFSYFAGTIEIQSAVRAFEHVHPGLKYFVAALFLIGFGGKAGVFLEHIWMPSSYGSAPCLTAALSSGIMIEVGAYGIFRTVSMIFAPSSQLGSPAAWMTSSHLGYVLIWVGIATMFLGAVNALFSTHALRLLAYSSVSQMGYIVMGIGCAAYMGSSGAMGLAGALYHIVNHALFKVGLFLSIGAVYFHTRELDIRKLGGLWREMPVAAATLLISALAISGFPLFNGFASKTMLHHAILEAYQHSVHLSLTHTPNFWLRMAEIIFIITAGGTFAYNMKLFVMVFLGPKKGKPISSSPIFMKVSLVLFSASILLLGLFPNWMLEKFIGPMLPYFGFNANSHAYHLIYNLHAAAPHSSLPLWYDSIHRTVLASTEVIHNLSGGSTAILAGGTIFLLFLGFGLFEKTLPSALGLTFYYQKVFEGFRSLCRITYQRVVELAEKIISSLMVYIWIPRVKLDLIIPEPALGPEGGYSNDLDRSNKGMFGHISRADQIYTGAIGKAGNIGQNGVFNKISQVDEKFSGSVDRVVMENSGIFGNLTRADDRLDGVFDKFINRFLLGVLTKPGGLKAGLWKYFDVVEDRYDRLIERAIFSIIGSEDLSKIKLEKKDFANSWFLRMCSKASEIHTGDISSYISWIAITLTAIMAIMVGFLYIKSFFAGIITFSAVIVLFFILALLTFFFKR